MGFRSKLLGHEQSHSDKLQAWNWPKLSTRTNSSNHTQHSSRHYHARRLRSEDLRRQKQALRTRAIAGLTAAGWSRLGAQCAAPGLPLRLQHETPVVLLQQPQHWLPALLLLHQELWAAVHTRAAAVNCAVQVFLAIMVGTSASNTIHRLQVGDEYACTIALSIVNQAAQRFAVSLGIEQVTSLSSQSAAFQVMNLPYVSNSEASCSTDHIPRSHAALSRFSVHRFHSDCETLAGINLQRGSNTGWSHKWRRVSQGSTDVHKEC